MESLKSNLYKNYWNHYMDFTFDSNVKSDSGKRHTKMFNEHDFSKIIEDLIKTKYNIIQCLGIQFTIEEITDIIYYLFYPHLWLAKDIIDSNVIDFNEYIEAYLCRLTYLQNKNTIQIDNLFYTEEDRNNFGRYIIGKKTAGLKNRLKKRMSDEKLINSLHNLQLYLFFPDDSNVFCMRKCYCGLITQVMLIMRVLQSSIEDYLEEDDTSEKKYHFCLVQKIRCFMTMKMQ